MVSIFRHGINNDDIGPIAKASFEETPEMFLKAAKHGELNIMNFISKYICVVNKVIIYKCKLFTISNKKITTINMEMVYCTTYIKILS